MRGFCKCFSGWYGLDCARLADPSILQPGAASLATPGAGAAAGKAPGAGGKAAAARPSSSSSSSSQQSTSGDDSIAAAERERQQAESADAADADAADSEDGPAAGAAEAAGELVMPEHVRFMLHRPHLLDVVVDAWQQSTSPAAADEAEEAAQPALLALGHGGGVARQPSAGWRAARRWPPPIPRLYSMPVRTWAAEEPSAGERPLPAAGRGGNTEAEAAAEAEAAEEEGDAEDVQGELEHSQPDESGSLPAAATQRQHVRGLRQHSSSSSSKEQASWPWQHRHQQQQQQPELQERPGFLRSLLRHFFTGGGSQRSELTLTPRQETVTAAVHAWLSGDAATTGSSGSGRLAGGGLPEALAAAGVQMHRLTSERDVALLQHMVEVALSGTPAGRIRRPRIFVYDMPSRWV
jgi:hypothetical protein